MGIKVLVVTGAAGARIHIVGEQTSESGVYQRHSVHSYCSVPVWLYRTVDFPKTVEFNIAVNYTCTSIG